MPILKVRPRALNVDVPAEETSLEEWTAAQNVVFKDDATLAAPGNEPVFGTPLVPPYFGQLHVAPNPTHVYAGLTGLRAHDGSVHASIQPAQGWTITASGDVTGGMYNGFTILNDQQHAPVSWTGALANIAVPLANWPAGWLTKAIRPFKYYLVAINIDKGVGGGGVQPYNVAWSTAAAPGTLPAWTPLPANDAGEVTLAGALSGLVDAAPVGEQLFIFELTATWALQYVGGAFIFTNRRVSNSLGIIGRNCWASVGRDLVFIGNGDIVISDGLQMKSIIDRRMRNEIFGSLSLGAGRTSWCARNVNLKQIYFGFPQGSDTEPRRLFVWDMITDRFGIVDIDRMTFGYAGLKSGASSDAWDLGAGNAEPWDTDSQLWDAGAYLGVDIAVIGCRPFAAAGVGQFEALGRSESPPDGPLLCYAEKSHMDMGSPVRVKRVLALYPKMVGPAGSVVNFRVGTAHNAGQPMTWGPPQAYSIGTQERVTVRATGRYVGVRIESQIPERWRMAGFDLEYQDAGGR